MKRPPEQLDLLVPRKRCSTCGVEKPATPRFFRVRKDIAGGLSPQCKVCRNQWKRDLEATTNYTDRWRSLHPERQEKYDRSAKRSRSSAMGPRRFTCPFCGAKDTVRLDDGRPRRACRSSQCAALLAKARIARMDVRKRTTAADVEAAWKAIRERRDEARRKRLGVKRRTILSPDERRERKRAHARRWWANLSDDVRERYLDGQRERARESYQNDEKFRARNHARKRRQRQTVEGKLAHRVSNAVWAGLHAKGKRKLGRTWDALGYTVAEMRAHLEAYMLEGMTWANYGTAWHIDHVIPLAALPFDSLEHPNFRAVWALGNLCPCWAQENVRKGSLHAGKRWRRRGPDEG